MSTTSANSACQSPLYPNVPNAFGYRSDGSCPAAKPPPPSPCTGSSLSSTFAAHVSVGTCPSGSSTIADSQSCVLSCAAGYTSSSYPIQTCSNGVWSGSQPNCLQSCAMSSPAQDPANGHACTGAPVVAGLLPSGSQCEITCNSGFILTGSATNCSNGVLSSQTCVAPPAGSCLGSTLASSYSNHAVAGTCPTGSSLASSGSTCAEACASGYSASSYPTQTCSAGTWSGVSRFVIQWDAAVRVSQLNSVQMRQVEIAQLARLCWLTRTVVRNSALLGTQLLLIRVNRAVSAYGVVVSRIAFSRAR